jgi:hypothetical protein
MVLWAEASGLVFPGLRAAGLAALLMAAGLAQKPY